MEKSSFIENCIVFSFENSNQSIQIDDLLSYLTEIDRCNLMSLIYQQGNKLIYKLCEDQGEISFNFSHGTVSGTVNTAFVGPGFHAEAIAILHKIEARWKVVIDIHDDTGYEKERDYYSLQKKYMQYLQKTVTELANVEEQSFLDRDRILANISGKRIKPVRTEKLLTPMGTYSLDVIKILKTEEDWMDFACHYFLWFEEKLDATYDNNLILYKKWNNDQSPVVQLEMQKELEDTCSDDNNLSGYLNGKLCYELPGGWSIVLSGYYEAEFSFTPDEEEDYPIVFIMRMFKFVYCIPIRYPEVIGKAPINEMLPIQYWFIVIKLGFME